MNSRRRKKKESKVKSAFLMVAAAVVMAAAIFIVVNVAGKIRHDYESMEFTKESVTEMNEIEAGKEEALGWNETDEGWRYLLKKDQYAVDQWLEAEEFLYYFGENGYMATGELKQEGQIFTFHESKGYLKDIQKDWSYVPASTGENLESLVKTNVFWCFLQDQEEGNRSPFRVIQYRKTVDNKVKVLGNALRPERTTRNSMSVYGDYLYFLPMVKDSEISLLDQEEGRLLNKLFRIIPGSDVKELIAENVDGFLVVNDVIYYAQGGKIDKAVSGTEYAAGDAGYSVVIENDVCYLVDENGMAVVPESGDSITIGDRVYEIESEGKIKSVNQSQLAIEGRTYYLEGRGQNASVSVETEEGSRSLIHEIYGVQSYCIVDKEIYFSAYVDKDVNGQWYSRIFKTDLAGENRQEVSERFPGSMGVMYYYENEGEIYGEYYPALWKQAYGQAVVITAGGSIYRIEDESVRTGKYTAGNDMLKLVMVKDGKLTALWQDCIWSESAGISGILWSKGVELDTSVRSILETDVGQLEEETAADTIDGGEDVIVRPLDGTAPGQSAETAAPTRPPVNRDPVISTDGPNRETSAPAPAPEESRGVVEIIPLD